MMSKVSNSWKMTGFSEVEAKNMASDRFSEENGTEIIWTKLNRLLEDGALDLVALMK